MHTKRRRKKVRVGLASVPIYRIQRTDGRSQWRVRWVDPVHGRKEKTFPTESEAIEHANAVARQIDEAPRGAVFVPSEEEKRAVGALRAISDASGQSIDALIADLREARGHLPDGMRLSEAMADWAAKRPVGPPKPLPEIVAEFVAAKRSASRSPRHVNDLELRLRQFTRHFQCRLDEITGKHVEHWLDTLDVAPRTRTNYLVALSNLVHFAERRRYVTRGHLEVGRIERTREDSEIGIFTPAQLREILTRARREMIPFLALGAFAGLRHAEAQRVEWSQIGVEWIEVKAKQAKTRARRLVPVLPALRAWVDPLRKTDREMACRFVNAANEIATLAASLSFPWVRNGLRHSFATYRLALTNDENRTAVEMGNSPAMIVRHYRALATPRQAEEWFGVLPNG